MMIDKNRCNLKHRCLPIGCEWIDNQLSFRVWAPNHTKVTVIITLANGIDNLSLNNEGNGYFSGYFVKLIFDDVFLYQFRLDDDTILLPDPASRFQPQGPHGPSQYINPKSFVWTDYQWQGINKKNAIIYEMHVGTFTPQGTWKSAIAYLPYLKKLGINVIEMMPVAEFSGTFGWGYDGVNLFSPYHHYGGPDDLRAFINKAHELDIGVILDVVYNHLGPDGNYLSFFSNQYFSSKHTTDWGDAINFDEPSGAVREFFITNACYWIDEYHFDGLRIDATQNIYDQSKLHVLAALVEATRALAAPKLLYIVAENEPQHSRYVKPLSEDGFGMDALWNDDFHHTSMVKLTGKREAYYTDYNGSAQEFIACAKYGFLFQGQWYSWQKQNRGTYALDLDASQFIHFIQNHDQIANSARGLRIHQLAHPSMVRVLTTLLLLFPQTPMIFQGQEYGANQPFNYFADHKPEIAKQIYQGRRDFLNQFISIASLNDEHYATFADPNDQQTFLACKLNIDDHLDQHYSYRLHQDLIALRKNDSVFNRSSNTKIEAAMLTENVFVLRFSNLTGERLILVNFSVDYQVQSLSEPLLSPPFNGIWAYYWSSDELFYGGNGVVSPFLNGEIFEHCYLSGYCVTILRSVKPVRINYD